MFDREALPRVMPFLAYLSFIFAADMLGRLGLPVEQMRWMYGLKIGVVFGMLWYWRHSYTELAWVPLGARAIAASLATGLIIFVLWISLSADWMSVGTSAGFDPRDNGHVNWSLVLLRIAGASLVVPVMEELFWRSFLLRWIDNAAFLHADPRLATAKAFGISVVLFGFEHNLWLAGIIAGSAYSILYMYSRNLWLSILAHGVTNAVLGFWILSGEHWTYW